MTGPVVPVSRELVDHYRTDPDEVAAREFVDALIRAEIDAAYTLSDIVDVPVTVDSFLGDQHRAFVTRQLRSIAEELGIREVLFPPPIGERVAALAADRRSGRSRWRYRGSHRPRPGRYTVADLERYVAAAADDVRRYHLRSLRRPVDMSAVFIGEREVRVHWYGVPGDPGEPATITFTPDDGGRLTIPALMGEPSPGEVSLDVDVPRVPDDELGDDVGQVVGVDLGIVEVGERDERPRPPDDAT